MTTDTLAIGIGLILVGVVMLIFEFVHPGTFMAIPGTIILFCGILLIAFGDFDILSTVGGPFLIVGVVIFAGVLAILFYSRMAPTHPPIASTFDTLMNFQGEVVTRVMPGSMKGKVRIRGEIWSATSESPIEEGTTVRVLGGEGVTLRVAPLHDESPSKASGASAASTEA